MLLKKHFKIMKIVMKFIFKNKGGHCATRGRVHVQQWKVQECRSPGFVSRGLSSRAGIHPDTELHP